MNQNAIETKRNLIEALLRIYEQKTVSQITVKEICSLAGYNRSTFYNHYNDVPSMLNQIEDETVLKLESVVTKLSEREIFQTDAVFEAIKNVYQDNQRLLSVLMTRPDSHFPQKLKGLMGKTIAGFLHDVSVEDNQKLMTAISYHFSAVIGVIGFWIENKDALSINQIIDYVREFTQEGILTVIQKMI